MQERVVGMNKECSAAMRRLAESAGCLKDLLTVHHKLMADVAVLLRTIHRIENLDFPTISDYLTRYDISFIFLESETSTFIVVPFLSVKDNLNYFLGFG